MGSEDPWEDTGDHRDAGNGENGKILRRRTWAALSVSASAPKYDNQGRELEYRCGSRRFTRARIKQIFWTTTRLLLSGGGSRGDAKYRVTDVENGNTTEITNAVSNQIDYTVEKKWKSGAQEGPVTSPCTVPSANSL